MKMYKPKTVETFIFTGTPAQLSRVSRNLTTSGLSVYRLPITETRAVYSFFRPGPPDLESKLQSVLRSAKELGVTYTSEVKSIPPKI